MVKGEQLHIVYPVNISEGSAVFNPQSSLPTIVVSKSLYKFITKLLSGAESGQPQFSDFDSYTDIHVCCCYCC